MKTRKRIIAASLLAATSLAISQPAWSLGLGDVTVESFLNQPLQVKIDLLTRETDDLTSVTARLASADDYALIGASRESVSVPIRFSVEDIEGDAYILATSDLPVGAPVVRLIVEVNWSSGRLLREYTIFLDPMTYSEPAPIPRIDTRNAPARPAAVKPAEPQQPAEAQSSPAAGTAAKEPSRVVPAEGEYGPVGDGETLWGIASNWSRGTGMDINQVMIAIQRENPGAFLKGNINLLKRGAILRMPRMDDIRSISTASAIQSVSEQAQEFQGGAAAPAVPASAASTAAPLMAEETVVPEVAETRVEDEVSAMEKDAEAVESVAEELLAEEEMDEELGLAPQLELVPPSEESDLDSAAGLGDIEGQSADASVAISTLREDLARTEEDLVTQQQQNEYLEQRIKELESQLASAEEDNVADADMANMEERLRQQRQAEEAARKASDKPWYSGMVGWLIGLLVIAAAAGAWIFNRRRWAAEFEAAAEDEQLREIKGEAEEVLRVLKDPETPKEPETPEPEEAPEESEPKPEKAPRERKPFGHGSDDAEVLDEESSDPEIQLDLARAYISMGDKEAARVILEEVQNNGNEEQQAEAKKMLNRLTS